jgi:hypothetical protein
MPIDIDAAERFIHANARLLDRHRLAVVLHGAPVGPVLDALRAYRNGDGGFGHGLEPDLRAPESEPACTFHALRVLGQVGALDDPMVVDAAAWVATVAEPDGGVPFAMPTAAAHPHAPFIEPSPGSSFLTFALASVLWEAGLGRAVAAPRDRLVLGQARRPRRARCLRAQIRVRIPRRGSRRDSRRGGDRAPPPQSRAGRIDRGERGHRG